MKESHKKPSLHIATSCVKGIANERKGIANEKKVKLLQNISYSRKLTLHMTPNTPCWWQHHAVRIFSLLGSGQTESVNVKIDEAKCRAVLEESLLRLQNTSYTSCTMHVPLFRSLLFPLNSHMLL
ncbi:hypothetical protein ILYODFUR_036269 [Ilyodon furcidens]|uniref:Uncharacterized protein n=1 Tax=Ilyodon furcidens TaxID=33524 RepID=A0ABV0U2D8_9TELE